MDIKSTIYQFFYENRRYLLDLFLVWLAFSSIFSYYKTGFISILYKFACLIISIVLSRFLLAKVCSVLKITSFIPTILCGTGIFVILNMILNSQVDVFFGKSRSFLDSLLGGVFGFGQFLLFCVAANFCILIMDQRGMSLPKWMQDIASPDKTPQKEDPMHSTLTYGVMKSITNFNVPDRLQKFLTWAGPRVKDSLKNYMKDVNPELKTSSTKVEESDYD